MYSVFYLQDHALWLACNRGDVVRAQELLSAGANINYHYEVKVSYSAHYYPLVGVLGINTLY